MLLSKITIVDTTDSSERGMNPVAMMIINPPKEYWVNRGSNQQPPVLKSAMLPTELWGSAKWNRIRMKPLSNNTVENGEDADNQYFLSLFFFFFQNF